MCSLHRFVNRIILSFTLLTLLLASCSMPNLPLNLQAPQQVEPQEEASPAATPTAVPQQAYAPAVIETVPLAGSMIGVQEEITFYFNQPMDRASVEAAWIADPVGGGEFHWADDATLTFRPSQPLQAGASLKMGVNAGARASSGSAFAKTESFTFNVAEALHPRQFLPEEGSVDISADAAVVVSFDQPVVSLGADPATLPAAFVLDPAVDGRGEWLNTSTYMFTPEPALAGGTTYRVSLNMDLRSVAGTSLMQANGTPLAWSFTTAKPRLLEISPATESPLPLDLELILTFNQPMDSASVEANLDFADESGNLSGSLEWADDLRSVTFTPNERLARNASYWLRLPGTTQALGGTPIDVDWNVEMISAPNFYVIGSTPEAGGVRAEYGNVSVSFSNDVDNENIDELVSINPDVPNYNAWAYDNNVQVSGAFEPDTTYILDISGELQDRWGETLGDDYELQFSTPNATPNLTYPYLGSSLYYTPAENASFYMQATNVSSAEVYFGEIPLNDFFRLFGPNGFIERENYQPTLPDVWRQPLNTVSNKSETIEIPLTDLDTSLTPGIYSLIVQGQNTQNNASGPVFIVASHANLVFKFSATDALVWATDVRTGLPFVDETVFIYNQEGSVISSGQTDPNGMWHGTIPEQEETYQNYYAMIGQPGAENFGFGTSMWGDSIAPWNFGLSTDNRPPHTEVYFYTDRPIYRPGQTVYFRAIVREAYDGRYQPSSVLSLPMTLANDWGENLQSFNPTLSPYGTANGAFTLPEDARPGYYSFYSDEVNFNASFQVADYRKPEINLSLNITPEEIKSGASVNAEISARYYFDAPAGDLPIQWTLYGEPGYFSVPGYQVGDVYLGWLRGDYTDYGYFGESLASGKGETNGDGTLSFSISDFEIPEGTRNLTFEITAQDESGQQISARQNVRMHPEDYYIGIRTDQWIGREETEMGFDILSVDWNGEPLSDVKLRADFKQVTWERQDPVYDYEYPTFVPNYTPVSNVDFVTGSDGAARLSFTPPIPGTYILDVSGGKASTQVLLWVRGAERAILPNLPKQHIRLTADRDFYQPGDTAQIFIPNPIEETTYALVTVERSTIHRTEILAVEPGGVTYNLPFTSDDAPGIFFSAVLLGGQEYRVGYVEIEVAPVEQILNISLTSQPARSEPGGEVTFGMQVTDAKGAPVQGEFSLAVVDLAALALADPNSEPIADAFYGAARIGVKTSLSYAGDSIYGVYDAAGGRGGGGGSGVVIVRDEFPDTAYWNAQIITDENGQAQVTMVLPDNLTTWHIDVRGLTNDTRVGSAEMEVVSTKDVLIRPITPRFMVVGDHVEMAAIVHNNTAQDLTGNVSLQAIGFLLDDPNAIEQQITVPAGGRTKVSWWGTAQDAETAELIFNSTFGDYQDMTRPTWGSLPILRYTSPQSFVTAGTLESAAVLTEQISLPRSFIPSGGRLEVELDPSLAAAILDGLEAIPAPPDSASTEAILSYLLPNVEMVHAMQAAGLNDPALQARLENSLQDGVRRLLDRQTEKNGWGWYATTASQSHGLGVDAMPKLGGGGIDEDDYLSAYVLYGLWRAQQSGVYIDETVFAGAREYLYGASLSYLDEANPQPWQKDRLVFIQYVLQMTGGADAAAVDQLVVWQEGLSPWAKALLALTLESRTSGDARARSLISNLEASALRSASGAHWESEVSQWRNPGTPNYSTATVLYALAQLNPSTPLVQDGTRYLVSHRNVHGYWSSTYENAWSLLALTQVATSGSELNASFNYATSLNGAALAEGQVSPLVPMKVSAPLNGLQLSLPNLLEISRTEGVGRLYYRAALFVDRAAETAPALNQGMEVTRTYYDAQCENDCQPINGVQMRTGVQVTVQLTLTLPEDSYYVLLEDAIPAGTEILNQQLKTSQQGVDATEVELYDPDNPFARGWGWWYFRAPEIGDESIQWSADYLPAGTYVLSYTLIPMQAGEFRVLPAHAWQSFFPEVQGTSAGELFIIR